MSRKCFLTCSLVMFGLLFVVGCGEQANVDPYAEVTLEQATRGPVVISKGFKYKFRNPNVVGMHGHVALVRDGNIMEVVVGRSLADKLASIDLKNYELNVKKQYQPYVNFKVEQIVSGTDTVFITGAGAIDYPKLYPAEGFVAKEHEDYSLDRLKFNRSADLEKARDKQFRVTGTVSIVEENGEEVYMLTGGSSTCRIVDPDDGVSIILKLLVDNNLPFDGGITFTEVEPWAERRDNQICGDVVVDFVKYMDKYVGS